LNCELPDDLARAIAERRAALAPLGSLVMYFPSVPSTNDVAATLARSGQPEGAVVLAEAQTRGRGRRGREWHSPAGGGLYVSVVLSPGKRDRDGVGRATRLLTLAAGVALAEAIETATGFAPDLKWPNDLYVGRRKLAGILAEAIGVTTSDPVVLGFGINVAATAFPPALRDRATSLESELGRSVDRALLFGESLARLARRYNDLLEGRFDAILDAWRSRAPGGSGARIRWESADGVRSGVTAGIDDEGALLVTAEGRLERIVAGEVTWL
jgi:BirA family biotin operon repressor/biotin-[acetyl-CoA-carboxylase] ligase